MEKFFYELALTVNKCFTLFMVIKLRVQVLPLLPPHSLIARAYSTSDAGNLWPNQRTSITQTVLMLGWPTLTRPAGGGCNVHIALLWSTMAIYFCTTQLLRHMNQLVV